MKRAAWRSALRALGRIWSGEESEKKGQAEQENSSSSQARALELTPPRFDDPSAGWLSSELFPTEHPSRELLVFKSALREFAFEERETDGGREWVAKAWFEGASEWAVAAGVTPPMEARRLWEWQARYGVSLAARGGEPSWVAPSQSSARLTSRWSALDDSEELWAFVDWLYELLATREAFSGPFGASLDPEASLRLRFPKRLIDQARVVEQKEDLEREARAGQRRGPAPRL